MSEAKSIFMNAYLKKLRRPELDGGYNPDQAFGANMVHGSESLNPNAIRDATNAQYGGMKNALYQGPSYSIPGQGSIQNVPFLGMNQKGQANTANQGIAAPMIKTAGAVAPKIISPWLADKIREWRSSMDEATKESLLKIMSQKGSTYDQIGSMAFTSPSTESGLGGFEKLSEGFGSSVSSPSDYLSGGSAAATGAGASEAIDAGSGAASGASGAMPFIGAGLKIGTDAATGKLQRKPGSSVGAAAGGAIGATAGTAIFPGVGTVIGGIAGSMIGDKIGTLTDEGISFKSLSEAASPPKMDTNPMSFLKMFGGGGGSAPQLSSMKMGMDSDTTGAVSTAETERILEDLLYKDWGYGGY